MAKIKSSDLFDGKLFEQEANDAQRMLDIVTKLKAELKGFSKTTSSAFKGGAPPSQQAQAYNAMSQAYKEYQKLEQQEIQLVSKLAALRTNQAKATEKARQQVNEMRKAVKAEVEEERGAIGAYTKKSRQLTDLRNKYKDLVAAQGAFSREARKTRAEVIGLDKELKRIDASVGQYQRSVGNYSSALGRLGSIASTFGVGIGAGFIARDVFGVIQSFDDSMANLRAVTGATGEEFKKLEADAMRLGASTKFTASEVAALQTEFGKLGFSTTEILNATEATLALAAAANMDLARAAEVAGATLRGFGLDASEMDRVVNVMAASFSKSALDSESFAEAMKHVAPVAKAAGVSIEETTAMLGTLANAGIKGSQAGTSLRQVLSQMDKTGKGTAQALKDLGEQGLNLADAEDEVGKNAKTALLVLTDQTKVTEDLTAAITGTDEAARQQAEQLDSVGGQLAILRSAWEGYILQQSQAGGGAEQLKDIIGFLSRNLDTIIKTILIAVKAWIAFKTALAIQNLVTGVAGTIQRLGGAISSMSMSMKSGAISAQGFGKALMGIPFVGIITGLVTVISLLDAFGDSADKAAKAQERLNKAAVDGTNVGQKAGQAVKSRIDLQKDEIRRELELMQAKGASRDQMLAKEKELTDAFKARIEEERKAFVLETIRVEHAARAAQEEYERLKRVSERLVKNAESIEDLKRVASIQEKMNAANEKATKLFFETSERQKAYNDLLQEQKESEHQNLLVTEQILAAKKSTTKEVKQQVEHYRSLEQIAQESFNETMKEELDLLEKMRLMRELEAEREFTDEDSHKLRMRDIEIDYLQWKIDLYSQYGEDYENTVLQYQVRLEQLKRGEVEKLGDLDEWAAESRKENLEEELALADTMNLQRIYQAEKEFKNQTEHQRNLKESHKSYLTDKLNAYKSYGDEYKDEIIKLETELLQVERDIQMQRTAEIYQGLDQLADAFMDRERERNAERMRMIDEQIRDSKARAAALRKIAEEGNLDAQKSIAAELQREKELEAEKEKIRKRQQRSEMALTAFKVYSQKVQQGDQRALASTIRDMSVLAAAIRALPTFFEGTEDTGTGGDIDSKKGFAAILHPHERVIPAHLNEGLKGMTNEEVAEAARMAKFAAAQPIKMTAYMGNSDVIRKFDELKQAIEKKPVQTIDYDKLSGMVIDKIEYKGRVIRKHYKNNSIN